MPLPLFPSVMFPNSVSVRLSTDVVNAESGANPGPGIGVDFPASVQPGETVWDGSGQTGVSRTPHLIKFQTDPALQLGRPIDSGDEIVWTDRGGIVLTALGPVVDSGGYGWSWNLKTEYVKS